MTPGGAQPALWSGVWRRVLRNPVGAVSVALLLLVIVSSFAAPLIAPYGPLTADFTHVLALPSGKHLLGTDELGRDVLSRLLYAGRPTLIGAAQAVGVAFVLGVPIGLIIGYFGGWADSAISRVIELFMSIPQIIVLLMALAVFGNNLTYAMVTLGVLIAPGLARITRGATIAIRNELYVTAARTAGLSRSQIIRRHVVPGVAGPVIVNLSLLAGISILAEAGLNFLGLGVQDPSPSWGGMVADASAEIQQQPWLLVPPGLIIAITVLSLVLFGDAVRDATAQAYQTATATAGRRRTHRAPRPTISLTLSPTLSVVSPAEPDSPPAEGSGVLLSVRDLTVAFAAGDDWTTVVDAVSFDVAPGEVVGLVGESGCGKTMTALSVLGLVPSGGQIRGGHCWFGGVDLAHADERELRGLRGRKIGFIAQEPMVSLDPAYTVGSQVAEAVRQHTDCSRPAARKRAIELLDMVDIRSPAEVAKRYPHEISGGMAQRVVIARALSGDPDLLIADEPTTALDVTIQAEILSVLRTLQHEAGMAVLLVTHDWGVVADICNRAIVMYAGQVVERADVIPVFRHPLHPYTNGLLQSDPHRVGDGERLTAIPGTVPPPGHWPSGCRFADRCPLATPDCSSAPVPLLEPEPGRFSRCIHSDRILIEAS
jgi:peptide/nickel transport system permease protein